MEHQETELEDIEKQLRELKEICLETNRILLRDQSSLENISNNTSKINDSLEIANKELSQIPKSTGVGKKILIAGGIVGATIVSGGTLPLGLFLGVTGSWLITR